MASSTSEPWASHVISTLPPQLIPGLWVHGLIVCSTQVNMETRHSILQPCKYLSNQKDVGILISTGVLPHRASNDVFPSLQDTACTTQHYPSPPQPDMIWTCQISMVQWAWARTLVHTCTAAIPTAWMPTEPNIYKKIPRFSLLTNA